MLAPQHGDRSHSRARGVGMTCGSSIPRWRLLDAPGRAPYLRCRTGTASEATDTGWDLVLTFGSEPPTFSGR